MGAVVGKHDGGRVVQSVRFSPNVLSALSRE
jgi:hypothetical protein